MIDMEIRNPLTITTLVVCDHPAEILAVDPIDGSVSVEQDFHFKK
jgi:hypothetical protein